MIRRRSLTMLAAAVLLGAVIGLGVAQDDADKARKGQKGKDEKIEGYTSVSVNIPAVTLNVVVTDKDGNLITGLDKSYFKVYEDGQPQELTNFFPDLSPINVVLVLESSGVIYGLEYDFWYAVLDFVKNLRPDDYCALITYDIKPRIAVDFTLDKQKIVREANISLYYKGFNESALADVVIFTIDRMREVQGKKAIIMLSTGLDTFSKKTYDDALKAAATSDTVIYAVSMGQLERTINEPLYSSATRSDLLMADLRLKSITKKTGGIAFFPRFSSEYPSVFRNLNMYLRYQYTMAYTPTNQKLDNKNRKIRVEAEADINRDGKPDKLKVSHKESYKAVEK